MIWLVALIVYALVNYALIFHLQFAEWLDVPREFLRGGSDEEAERGLVRRWLFKLFDCAFCLGTWSGLAFGIVGVMLLRIFDVAWSTDPVVAGALVCTSALASATLGLFGYMFTQKLL